MRCCPDAREPVNHNGYTRTKLEGVEKHEVFVQTQESRVQSIERPADLVQPFSLCLVGQACRRIVNEQFLHSNQMEGTARGRG